MISKIRETKKSDFFKKKSLKNIVKIGVTSKALPKKRVFINPTIIDKLQVNKTWN
jgi:hypothetical protein